MYTLSMDYHPTLLDYHYICTWMNILSTYPDWNHFGLSSDSIGLSLYIYMDEYVIYISGLEPFYELFINWIVWIGTIFKLFINVTTFMTVLPFKGMVFTLEEEEEGHIGFFR